jgi:hypothetical protein
MLACNDPHERATRYDLHASGGRFVTFYVDVQRILNALLVIKADFEFAILPSTIPRVALLADYVRSS